MLNTLGDLKAEADARRASGNLLGALKIYRLVLEAAPLDFELRLQIGDLLASLQRPRLAAAVYYGVALHDTKSGNPLRGIAALKRLEKLGGNTTTIVDQLAGMYAFGSSCIGQGLKPAPTDYSAKLRKNLEIDYDIDDEHLVNDTAKMAAYIDNIQNYPKVVPPVPIFSALIRDAFKMFLGELLLRSFQPGDPIINQGDPGHAVYFLCRGEVSVVRRTSDIPDEEKDIHLARLGPGSLFGEMALINSDPRSASVICETPVDVLELTRESVNQVARKMPQVAQAMARFTQERMITNLLATNPLFKPFDEESKKQLLARFTGHEVPEGTIFLEQGQVGNGLYIILQGKAVVLKWDEEEYVELATLGPGDVAGEMSLLFEEPVSATVKTTSPATLLFLARELFTPLVEALPELLAHFNRLAENRLAATEEKMASRITRDVLSSEDNAEEETQLDEDDLVFI